MVVQHNECIKCHEWWILCVFYQNILKGGKRGGKKEKSWVTCWGLYSTSSKRWFWSHVRKTLFRNSKLLAVSAVRCMCWGRERTAKTEAEEESVSILKTSCKVRETTLEAKTQEWRHSERGKGHRPVTLVRIFPHYMPLPGRTVSSGFLDKVTAETE